MTKQDPFDTTQDPRVRTWADGFGNWHVLIPEGAAEPLLAARRAIRNELFERSDMTPETLEMLSAHVRKNVVRSEVQDNPGFIHFKEGIA